MVDGQNGWSTHLCRPNHAESVLSRRQDHVVLFRSSVGAHPFLANDVAPHRLIKNPRYEFPYNPGTAGVFPFHAERVASQSPQSGHERAQLLRNFLSRLLEVSNRHLDPIRRHETSIKSLDDSVATLNPGLAALLILVEPTFGLARYLQAQLHGPILLVEPILHIICHVGPNNEFIVALKCQPARRAQIFPKSAGQLCFTALSGLCFNRCCHV